MSFDASSEEVFGEEGLGLVEGRAERTGRYILVFVDFGCRQHRFTLFCFWRQGFSVVSYCLWHWASRYFCQVANEAIIRTDSRCLYRVVGQKKGCNVKRNDDITSVA